MQLLNAEMQEQHSPYRTWHNFILGRTAPLPGPGPAVSMSWGATGEQLASADSTSALSVLSQNQQKL